VDNPRARLVGAFGFVALWSSTAFDSPRPITTGVSG